MVEFPMDDFKPLANQIQISNEKYRIFWYYDGEAVVVWFKKLW